MQTKVYKMGNKLGIYFPKNKQTHQKADIILLAINKNSKEVKLITKFNYNIIIRRAFINKLRLNPEDIINIKVEKIKNLQRVKRLFYRNKIDLLSLIPKKTSQGYDIIVSSFLKNNEKWLRLWYSHNRGSGRQLELRRFIDTKKFGSLLGQYQAEGTKHKNTIKKFRIEFKNKLIEEHKEFLENVTLLGVKKENFKARFHYNPWKEKRNIKKLIKDFEKKIGLKVKISKNKDIKGIGFELIVRNTLLTEIILNSMHCVRKKYAGTRGYNKDEQNLVNSFFAKLLTGDGTLHIRKRYISNFEVTIAIGEGDREYLKDYLAIMDNLNFKSHINGKIYVKSYCKFNQLLYLHNIKAFLNTKNWYRLLIAIDLYSNRENHPYKDNKKILDMSKKDLISLKKEKGITDSIQLLNSLKTKPNKVIY